MIGLLTMQGKLVCRCPGSRLHSWLDACPWTRGSRDRLTCARSRPDRSFGLAAAIRSPRYADMPSRVTVLLLNLLLPDWWVISSVSGLLRDSAYLRQARSRRLSCYPRVAVTTLDRPSERARGGHDHGSGVWLSDLANLCCRSGHPRSPSTIAAKVIPRIFRIMTLPAA